MDKWLKRKVTSVDAKDLAEAGSSKKTEMEPVSGPAHKKKRTYNESYLQYGLHFLPEKYLLASYQASYLIAKAKKPYTIGEELVLPTAVQITETIHGKKYADELWKIPLSNDIVTRRISEISCDQFQQLIQRIKESPKFAIRLDESTDITNLAQLLVYEEGLDWNNCIGVCSDGAAATKKQRVGFLAKVKSITNGHIILTHCIIHREALVAKKNITRS
ncbi:protein FAM200A-like [Centruroides vittatus]|uniref:protein FAM200A-like n=1 Tax=Centruroides vittatus TaxID=120091 RepID=UPI00350F4BA6